MLLTFTICKYIDTGCVTSALLKCFNVLCRFSQHLIKVRERSWPVFKKVHIISKYFFKKISPRVRLQPGPCPRQGSGCGPQSLVSQTYALADCLLNPWLINAVLSFLPSEHNPAGDYISYQKICCCSYVVWKFVGDRLENALIELLQSPGKDRGKEKKKVEKKRDVLLLNPEYHFFCKSCNVTNAVGC